MGGGLLNGARNDLVVRKWISKMLMGCVKKEKIKSPMTECYHSLDAAAATATLAAVDDDVFAAFICTPNGAIALIKL